MPEIPEDICIMIVQELKLLHTKGQHGTYWPRLAPYAGVCRPWNAAIERETFKHLHVCARGPKKPVATAARPNNAETAVRCPRSTTTARFKQMMARDPARPRAIRHIDFRASTAMKLDSKKARTEAGAAKNDEEFSRSVLEFWEVLKDCDVPDHARIHLNFGVDSLPLVDWDQSADNPGRKVYLRLVSAPLPRLRCFGSFELNNGPRHIEVEEGPRIWPLSVMHIVSSLEGLTRKVFKFDDFIKDPIRCRSYRDRLGRTITKIPRTCRELDARFYHRSLGFEEEPHVTPGTPDLLCIGLRDVSTHLRKLNLVFVRVSPALFWPGDDEGPAAAAAAPFWPHLTHLKMEPEPSDPYGTYYADPDADVLQDIIRRARDREYPDRVRRTVFRPPARNGLHRLLSAAARAARSGRMPRLKALSMDIFSSGSFWFAFSFGGGRPDEEEAADELGFRITLNSRPRLPGSGGVLDAWGVKGHEVVVVDETADGLEMLEARVGWRPADGKAC